jgi:N-acyl homoserine lactone hydrolase
MAFRIVPLRVGDVQGAAFPETGTPLVFFMFLILGRKDPILVDTGTPAAPEVLARQSVILRRPADEDPATQLAAHGVRVTDIRMIVQSHLHWDHAGGGGLFPDAEIVVQDAELRYAVHPTMGDRAIFDLVPGAVPAWLADIPRMRVVLGDADLGPDLRVLLTPGHTPGSQAVVVETARGRHVLTGDTVPSYRHWRGDGRGHIFGPNTDPESYQRSLARLDDLESDGAVMIPSHDPDLVTRGPFG